MFESKNLACKEYCDKNNIKFKLLFKEDIYGKA